MNQSSNYKQWCIWNMYKTHKQRNGYDWINIAKSKSILKDL